MLQRSLNCVVTCATNAGTPRDYSVVPEHTHVSREHRFVCRFVHCFDLQKSRRNLQTHVPYTYTYTIYILPTYTCFSLDRGSSKSVSTISLWPGKTSRHHTLNRVLYGILYSIWRARLVHHSGLGGLEARAHAHAFLAIRIHRCHKHRHTHIVLWRARGARASRTRYTVYGRSVASNARSAFYYFARKPPVSQTSVRSRTFTLVHCAVCCCIDVCFYERRHCCFVCVASRLCRIV